MVAPSSKTTKIRYCWESVTVGVVQAADVTVVLAWASRAGMATEPRSTLAPVTALLSASTGTAQKCAVVADGIGTRLRFITGTWNWTLVPEAGLVLNGAPAVGSRGLELSTCKVWKP